LAGCASSAGESATATNQATAAAVWGKTFPKNDKVDVEKVTFDNRLGIKLVGDLYVPKNIDRSVRHPAIIVGHPYGGVKEQSSGLYAQQMAERGFVTLAFDASSGGESGGTPRNIASPEAFTEDFSAAVDYLGTNELVDRNRIGVIGVCGSGSFSLSAAAVDPRIRALATVSMYDMGRAMRQGLNDTVTEEQRKLTLEQAAQQRWSEREGGNRRMVPGTPYELTEQSSAVDREFYDYYRTPCGQHPRSTTEFTFTSSAAMHGYYPFAQIAAISPRPLLFPGPHRDSRSPYRPDNRPFDGWRGRSSQPPPSPAGCTPCARSASSSTGKFGAGPSPSTAQHRSRLARLDHHRRNPLRPSGAPAMSVDSRAR
jgi:fermentation-respiration switch protein FrsA (DUF1100 family)